MKLKEWIQIIGKRDGLENGQGVVIGGGVYAKYYETPPQRKASPPPPPKPSNLGKNTKEK